MPADISVIIGAYNVERYIERAVRSALRQEGGAVEIIVIDDKSSDGTRAIVSRINDPRVRLISLPVNSGPSVSRNAGVAAASAPWIAILDGDDMFLEGRLARCLQRAKSLDADIVVDNLLAHREIDKVEYPMFSPSFSRLSVLTLEKFIAGKRFFVGPGEMPLGYLKPMFKAEFLRERRLRYDPALRIGEDYKLMFEALASGARCAVEPTTGYFYTVRGDSLSPTMTLADLDRMAEVDERLRARYNLSPTVARLQKRQRGNLQEYSAYVRLTAALKRHDIKGAIRAASDRPLAARHLLGAGWRRVERLIKKLRRGDLGPVAG
jgi:succinoglycan biosynthesis protein ExoO